MVYEGREPTRGGPWLDIPLPDAIASLDLRQTDFVSELSSTPRFGELDRDLWFAGYKHIIVEVGVSEARKAKWKPGFYRSPVKPKDAFGRLIQQVLVAELGRTNVIRVEHEPITDSLGREALRITVVITPDAAEKVKNGAALNALINLQERLRHMRDSRTPIIEYATEAELKQDGGP